MTAVRPEALRVADRHCRSVLRHYENFTVASRLAPVRLRRDLTRVYAFCRITDDLGDESGSTTLATDRLQRWRAAVEALFDGGAAVHPALIALAVTVRHHHLPARPFLDLIDANLQDQRVSAYSDWSELLGYCRLSAAPVGRIVLQLFGITDTRAPALSDDVCIGLQLANFAQDVRSDAQRGRTYLLGVDVSAHGTVGATRAMCRRAQALLASGRELETMVPPRFRLQLALYRLGGEAILAAIGAQGWDATVRRPTVAKSTRMRILAEAVHSAAMSGRRDPAKRGIPVARDV